MIKVVLLSEKNFINNIEKAFNEFLSDRINVKCFSDKEKAYDYIKSCQPDILVSDEDVEIDRSIIPEKCAGAYFSESLNICEINGEKALFIYQNINDIYNSVMNIIESHNSSLAENPAENKPEIKKVSMPENKKAVITTFFSCTGGSGGSVFSKAFAVNKANENEKVLYIPLEICTSANTVFIGGDALSLSDIFHDISTGKDKATLKKTISRSFAYDEKYKVYFIPPFYNINDLFSITEKQFSEFMDLIAQENFSHIIIDADFSLPAILSNLIKKTNSIVMLSNGTEHSNLAIERMYNYINFVGEDFVNKINIIYNRFVNGTSKIYTRNRINILGGIGKLSKSSRKYVIESVSKSEVFANLK